MAEHIKGKLRLHPERTDEIWGPDDQWFASARSLEKRGGRWVNAEIARRLVACWNALEGIDTSTIEAGLSAVIEKRLTSMVADFAKETDAQKDMRERVDLAVAEARAKGVCRICGERVLVPLVPGLPDNGPFRRLEDMKQPAKLTLNFGEEFAHTECLRKQGEKPA